MRAALQYFLRRVCGPGAAILLGLWLGVAPPGATAQPEMSRDEARQQLDALRERMAVVQAGLKSDRGERGGLEQRIEALDRDIAELTTDIRGVAHRREKVRQAIAELGDRRQALRRQMATQRERVAELAYSTYVMGRQSQLKLFLNQRSPAVINRMLGYHDYIIAARARTIDQINDWAGEVAALSARQEAKQAELKSLEAEYRAEQAKVQARREERETALAALTERISSSEDELARLRDNENRLQAVLREIEKVLRERETRRLEKGAFGDMKGKLQVPVAGSVSAGFGDTRNTGVKWEGVMFRPDTGADVRAVYAGQVVFADWLRGFGLLLIIDHGGGFMSLYSHNESLRKQLGDWVDTSEVISTAGTSGGLDKPGLYFEIRNKGEPQNPAAWFRKG